MPIDFERRNKRRAMVSQPVRVRPSEPTMNDFDEVRRTVNICRDGIYFHTELPGYFKGQRLAVTMPYSPAPGAVNPEYIGEVVRIDSLPHKQRGVAIQLKMSFNLKTN